jgi:hypothetical protein
MQIAKCKLQNAERNRFVICNFGHHPQGGRAICDLMVMAMIDSQEIAVGSFRLAACGVSSVSHAHPSAAALIIVIGNWNIVGGLGRARFSGAVLPTRIVSTGHDRSSQYSPHPLA